VVATAGTPAIVRADERIDWLSALIGAHRTLHPEVENLLVVGGERFVLVRFSDGGEYESSRGNTSCAAGTGAFLDQQAVRLGLPDSAALGELAASNTGSLPRIASRCSVFAKTDLIHAQQEGYSRAEICDGLCRGLARNLVDAVVAGSPPGGRLVMAGGVALNRAVVSHVGDLLEKSVIVDEYAPVYAALGAALVASQEELPVHDRAVDDILDPHALQRRLYHAALETPTGYPDFTSHATTVWTPCAVDHMPVEVDFYEPPAVGGSSAGASGGTAGGTSGRASGGTPADSAGYLGIDVGSTSTKAVVTDSDGETIAAFYTRTAGAPIRAVQALFEAIHETLPDHRRFTGVATTGSGRKLIGSVIRADLVLDEISAHARAAVELEPDVDTIIEIGGQDAKFTTLRNGRVTFSQMNAVCAAGTGSFLEEQAIRLQVPLAAYAEQAIGSPAPLASDRCTVFMERDINHHLTQGHTTGELLAAALHSVRENYLQKVATLSSIGDVVCFQGATAKNPGLIAAFEHRLGKRMHVSRYCHVTGALGAALTCREEFQGVSQFRGIDLFRSEIPVRSERCSLCTNNCRLTIARVDGEDAAYGFLCGRDYGTSSYVSANTSGYDLMTARRRADRSIRRMHRRVPRREEIRVGIPSGLHLADESAFWHRVFGELGIATVEPARDSAALARGKQMQGAEFCTPVAEFHGQVAELLDTADVVFLPIHLERPDPENHRRAYCYYTQFTPSVIQGTIAQDKADRLMTPVIWARGRNPVQEFVRALEPWVEVPVGDARTAFRIAREATEQAALRRQDEFRKMRRDDHADVVLLGRPYTAVDPGMNKRIPDLLGRHGARCFYQDMLPRALPSEAAAGLIEAVHWRYAADILLAADYISTSPGLYPVLVTSFKCAPDAFCIDAFKRIMDRVGKPYLVLQLDEHDSSVGYETRIEAALRSFRNHFQEERGLAQSAARIRPARSVTPPLETAIGDRTLLLPCWDQITSPLLAANLRHHGIKAVALDETSLSIQESMRLNTGQCIPVSAIAQGAMDYVRTHDLDPADAIVWMGKGNWSCGIPLYPQFIKGLFEQEGLSNLSVYIADFTFTDISPRATIGAYFAYQFGGWLRALICRTRPYEFYKGQTDETAAVWQKRLEDHFEFGGNRIELLREMIAAFQSIPVTREPRPKVGVFGDLYVRDNDVMNQDLIRKIEAAGGEAVTMPYSDYVKIVARSAFGRMLRRRDLAEFARLRIIFAAIERLERPFQWEIEPVLGPPVDWRRPGLDQELSRFNMVLEQAGESYDNALKILNLITRHPEIALFVQTSPAFCCPSLVTEALSELMERVSGVPIVTITYDGTEGDKNSAITPYIRFPRKRRGGKVPEKTA
jgi:predicted CoA-substrate-specific enzyme activase